MNDIKNSQVDKSQVNILNKEKENSKNNAINMANRQNYIRNYNNLVQNLNNIRRSSNSLVNNSNGLNQSSNKNDFGSNLKSIIGKRKKNFFSRTFFNKKDDKKDDSTAQDSNDSLDTASSDQNSDSNPTTTSGSFEILVKYVKAILIAFAPSLGGLVIACLLICAPLVKLDLIGIGSADSSVDLSESEINDSFDDHKEDSDLEIDDDPYESGEEETNSQNVEPQEGTNQTQENANTEVGDNSYFPAESNLTLIARKRTRNEARLDELSDYYPVIKSYRKKYDANMLYNFFYKIHLISNTYKEKYNVNVDVPLLMSTLMMQAQNKDNMNIFFDSNLGSEDNFYEKKENKEDNNLERFYFDYDWSGYTTSKSNSEHDIEVLVQNMFSEQVKETCVDSGGKVKKENILRDEEIGNKTLTCEEGEEYKTESLGMKKDDKKYKKFLRTFLKQKYYSNSLSSCTVRNPFKKYNLTSEQILDLTTIAIGKGNNLEIISAEASLMANLFELNGSSYGNGGNGLYNYVVNSNLFSKNTSKTPSSTEIEIVTSVLVDGKRTLPGYIDQSDCAFCNDAEKASIVSVTNEDKDVDKENKDNYKQFISLIKNNNDLTYTFYSFVDDYNYLYGYSSEENRTKIGDFYYDFNSGEPSECISTGGTDLSSAFVKLAVDQLNDPSRYGGEKYWRFMGYSSHVYWCASFVSWAIHNTNYNGQNLNQIINHKSGAVSSYMDYFYYNKESNIKFYYNDNCSSYKGKNNTDSSYIPKEGDLIFFDWQACWPGDFPRVGADDYCGQDHIGIVQYVEDKNIITIEGNANDEVKEKSYALDSCQVIGFGSWY